MRHSTKQLEPEEEVRPHEKKERKQKVLAVQDDRPFVSFSSEEIADEGDDDNEDEDGVSEGSGEYYDEEDEQEPEAAKDEPA